MQYGLHGSMSLTAPENRGMPGSLMARPLERDQIAQAFPLLHLVLPDLTLAGWRRYATSLIGRVDSPRRSGLRGIMTVQNRRGYLQGLFCYRVQKGLASERQMVLEGISAQDLVPGQQAGLVLGRALTTLARDLGCREIFLHLPSGLRAPNQPRWLSDFMAAAQTASDHPNFHIAEAVGI